MSWYLILLLGLKQVSHAIVSVAIALAIFEFGGIGILEI